MNMYGVQHYVQPLHIRNLKVCFPYLLNCQMLPLEVILVICDVLNLLPIVTMHNYFPNVQQTWFGFPIQSCDCHASGFLSEHYNITYCQPQVVIRYTVFTVDFRRLANLAVYDRHLPS